MKKFLLVSVLAATILLFGTIESYAYSCAPNIGKSSLKKKVKRSAKDADAVFSGETLRIQQESLHTFTVKIKQEYCVEGK